MSKIEKDYEAIRKRQKELKPSFPTIGSLWKHYKGGIYVVRLVTMREKDYDVIIDYDNVYHPLEIPWSRPLSEWKEIIDGEPRFREIVNE